MIIIIDGRPFLNLKRFGPTSPTIQSLTALVLRGSPWQVAVNSDGGRNFALEISPRIGDEQLPDDFDRPMGRAWGPPTKKTEWSNEVIEMN